MSALMPCSLASAALACALQSASSRAIVWSSAPPLTQSVPVGACPAQDRQQQAAESGAGGGQGAAAVTNGHRQLLILTDGRIHAGSDQNGTKVMKPRPLATPGLYPEWRLDDFRREGIGVRH
jgi:hypothetical protein